MQTLVIFRKYREGDIVALFPEIASDMDYVDYCKGFPEGSYNIGDVMCETTPATPKEYSKLAKRLRQLDYNLKVVKQFEFEHVQARINQIDAVNRGDLVL